MPGADINIRIGADITDLRTQLAAGTTAVKTFTATAGLIGPGMASASREISNLGVITGGSVEKLSKTQKAIEHLTSADDIAAHSIRGFGRELLHIGPALAFEGLVAGVGLLVAFASELFAATGAAKEFAEQQKMVSELEDQASKSAGKEAGDLVVLRGAIESNKVPMATRLQAIKNLKAEFPGLFTGLTTEQLLTGNVANAYDLATAAILRKARASAASGQIQELAAKKFAILQKAEDDRQKSVEDAKNAKGGAVGYVGTVTARQESDRITALYNIRAKGYQEELDQLNHQQGFLMQYVIEGAADQIRVTKDKAAGTKKALTESFNADFDIYKIAQARKIRLIDEGINDEAINYTERLSLLRDFIAESQSLINEQEANDIKEIRKKEKLDIANLEREKKKGADIAGIIKEQGIIRDNADQHVRDIIAKSQDESYKLIDNGNKKFKALGEQHNKIVSEQDQEEIDYEEFTANAIEKARKAQAKKDDEFLKKQQDLAEKQAKIYDDLGDSIGKSLVTSKTAGDFLKSIFKDALSFFGDFVQAKGKKLVALGILDNLAFPGSGAKDIIAGVGEIALGSALKNFQFATGVSGFSGGAAIVGERGPELVNLPKGSSVTPNAQLNSMGNNAMQVYGKIEIEGTKLVTLINRAEKLMSRNGW